MTNCQHDPTYRTENEANGGAGCPICNRSNAAAVKWSTDAERAEAHTQAVADMARLSAYMGAAYEDLQHGERGAGCAGNEPETCEAGGWG